MKGIDFGGYTEWERPDNPPQSIDFVICGVAWGQNKNTTYDVNLPALQKEKRLMTYGFYNGQQDIIKQAKKWVELSVLAGSQAIFLDWERSKYSNLKNDPKRHAKRLRDALNYVSDNFGGRAGIYSNFNDYVAFLQPYVDVRDVPWWVAWPDDSFDSPPGNSWWWNRINRERNDYIIDQYSWKGDAPAYGATNSKRSMDLNIAKTDLDVWLGIEDEPEQPVLGTYEDGRKDALELWRKSNERDAQIIEGA